MDEIIRIVENNHVGPPWAYVLVFALESIIVLALAFCVRAIRRAKRAQREAAVVANPNTAPFEGARFVAGTVELAQDEVTAIQVTVTQRGSEVADKNGTRHRWEEIHREQISRPFYL